MRRRLLPFVPWFCCSIIACFGGWIWQGLAADPASDQPAPGSPELRIAATQTLGGPDRYLTFLSTDKPIYRAGETVFVRGVLLHHATRRPLPADQQTPAVVEIHGPKGDVVASGQVTTEDSVAGFQWTVPDGQAGGEYTIEATYPFTRLSSRPAKVRHPRVSSSAAEDADQVPPRRLRSGR